MVVSPSKTRIIHDLTFSFSQHACSVNANTDFAQPPPRRVGSRVAKYYGAHLVSASRFGPRARIAVNKIDVTEAFRRVSVQRAGALVFGHAFRDLVVADRNSWMAEFARGFCFPQLSNTLIATRRTATPW